MQYLRKATSVTIMFGPFVSSTDGVTLKTDATTITDIDHASTGIFLSKAGATAAIRNGTPTASVADAYGMMRVTLNTTDTGTTGMLDVLFAKAATYLPVSKQFEVLEQVVYDVLFGTVALATLSNITSAAGVALAADQAVNATKIGGTTQTGRDIGASVLLSSGTGTGQLSLASGAVLLQATQTGVTIPTVTNLTNLPAAAALEATAQSILTDTAEIGVAGAGLTALASAANLATVAGYLDTEIADIQSRIPAALVGGRMDSNVSAIGNDTTALTAFKRAVLSNVIGTVGAASSTTSIVTSSLTPAAAVTDQFKGRILIFDKDTTTANLRGQGSDITASTAAGVLTVTALTDSPVSGDTFTIT